MACPMTAAPGGSGVPRSRLWDWGAAQSHGDIVTQGALLRPRVGASGDVTTNSRDRAEPERTKAPKKPWRASQSIL